MASPPKPEYGGSMRNTFYNMAQRSSQRDQYWQEPQPGQRARKNMSQIKHANSTSLNGHPLHHQQQFFQDFDPRAYS